MCALSAYWGLDGIDYLDKVGGGRQQQHGAITFSGETDRVYLATTAECIIDDPGLQRRIIIAKRGSRSTVVWNPWIDKAAKLGDLGDDGYLRMVCVESANAADDAVVVATGGEHRLGVRYTVEARCAIRSPAICVGGDDARRSPAVF